MGTHVNKVAKVSAIILPLLAADVLPAAPIIDGTIGAGEYANGFIQSYRIDGGAGSPVQFGDATIYWDQAANNDLAIGVMLSNNLVDNTYGLNAIGYGSVYSDGHPFKDLLGSDKAQFIFRDDGGADILSFTMDYLHKASDTEYRANATDGDGKDGGSFLLESESSMTYNFANHSGATGAGEAFDTDEKKANSPLASLLGDVYTVADPAFSDWDFLVTYELKIDGSYLGAGDAGLFNPGKLSIAEIHISDAKFGHPYHTLTPSGGPTPLPITTVPEPTSAALFGLAVAGVGMARRRRRSAPAK